MTKVSAKFIDGLEAEAISSNPKMASRLRELSSFEDVTAKLRENLRMLRGVQKKTLADVGRLLGISASGISKIENGAGDIGVQTICKYAKTLGCNVRISFIPKDENMDSTGMGWSAFVDIDRSGSRSVSHERLKDYHDLIAIQKEMVDDFEKQRQLLEDFTLIVAQIEAETVSAVERGSSRKIPAVDSVEFHIDGDLLNGTR